MKKGYLILSILLIPIVALAQNNESEQTLAGKISNLKYEVGSLLESVLPDFRNGFRDNSAELNTLSNDISNADSLIISLKNAEIHNEADSSILKHGRKQLKNCKDYTKFAGSETDCIKSNSLIWQNNSWKWVSPDIAEKCIASNNEYSIKNGEETTCQRFPEGQSSPN
jgi:hypothetical protein